MKRATDVKVRLVVIEEEEVTVVEERGLGVARRRAGRGGGGRGASRPPPPLAHHVDLLLGLISELHRRRRLPLLSHEATRHRGARIGLSDAASEKDREKREEKRAPSERRRRARPVR